jgi:hypothetical protein
MRKLITVLLLGFTWICLGEPSQKQLPIMKKERSEIQAVVKKETDEKVLSVERESEDTVQVRTGVVTPGRLEGKGQTFWLKRTKKGWQIQKKGIWIS